VVCLLGRKKLHTLLPEKKTPTRRPSRTASNGWFPVGRQNAKQPRKSKLDVFVKVLVVDFFSNEAIFFLRWKMDKKSLKA
jgi:hypothetical protein